jgi:hypothetical protein
MATTSITVSDEATRRALLGAVWEHAALEVNEELYNPFQAEAEAALERTGPSQIPWFSEVGDQVALLRATFDAAELLQTAQIGDVIEIALSLSALAKGLSQSSGRIVEDEVFWSASPDVRERRVATFDRRSGFSEFSTEAVA